jgi:hypothetical protein
MKANGMPKTNEPDPEILARAYKRLHQAMNDEYFGALQDWSKYLDLAEQRIYRELDLLSVPPQPISFSAAVTMGVAAAMIKNPTVTRRFLPIGDTNMSDPKEGVDKTIPGADGEANMGQDAPGPVNPPNKTDEEAKKDGQPSNPDAGQTEGN